MLLFAVSVTFVLSMPAYLLQTTPTSSYMSQHPELAIKYKFDGQVAGNVNYNPPKSYGQGGLFQAPQDPSYGPTPVNGNSTSGPAPPTLPPVAAITISQVLASLPSSVPKSPSGMYDNLPPAFNGKFQIMHPNGQGWCLDLKRYGNLDLHICDTPGTFKLSSSQLTKESDHGYFNILETSSMQFIRRAGNNNDLNAHAYVPGQDGLPGDYSWTFQDAKGGYVIRNLEKNDLVGYDTGNSRQRMYAGTDARLVIWYIRAV
jgi:hypothetical protein